MLNGNSARLSSGGHGILDSIRNIKASNIEIADRLTGLERDWLIGRLASKRGVQDAGYDRNDASRLVVEYDADVVDLGELFDFLHVCGLHPALAPIKLT